MDFTRPTRTNISEVLVTAPGVPASASVDDLSGREVFVRKTSSYYESLEALNQSLQAEAQETGRRSSSASESLEDDDLLEMVNAGLIPAIVVDNYLADFWKQVFPDMQVHGDIALRTGGSLARGDPQEQPEAEGRARWLHRQERTRLGRWRHPEQALSAEHEVRQERHVRRRAQEVRRA